MHFKETYRKYKFIIWLFFSGVSSVVILTLVIIPQFITYLNTNGKITNLTNQSSSLEVKADTLERFDEVSTRRDLQTVLTILPTEQDVPKSMVIIESLIKKSGLELKGTGYVASRKLSNKPSFQLNMSVTGQISAVRDFLISLQDASQVFQVESISVQFQKSGSMVEADIPITVFYEPPPKSISSISEPLNGLNQDEEHLLARLSRLVPQIITSPSTIPSTIPLGKSDPFE